MYGYLNYSKDEMKVKHIKLYQKYYCLLCTRLGEEVGFIYRFLTSYDITAFIIMFDNLFHKEKIEYFIACPLSKKKNSSIKISEEAIYYGILTCLFSIKIKIKDNYMDERGILWKWAKHKMQNSRVQILLEKIPQEKWKEKFERYYAAEKDESQSFDSLMTLIGDSYGTIFLDCISDHSEYNSELLYRLGSNIGKYIYLMDAYDDYFDDVNKNRFNPICRMLDYNQIQEDKVKIKNKIYFIISMIIYEITQLSIKIFQPTENLAIIQNIIKYGMIEKYYFISNKKYRSDQ